MKLKKYPKLLIILSLVFFAVNILQSIFTELHGDEAYYWRYAQDLDWGYFDHPPFVALMIKLSGLLLPMELGVRFLTVVVSFISIFLLWELLSEKRRTEKRNIVLFSLLFVSMPVFNIYSFITTPDVFLIFFGLLFLITFKRFREVNSYKHAVFLGILMALLMYSKYHGALIIIFCILSDIKILKNKKLWFSILFSILLFIPHILWQITNDFPSVKYHLVERSTDFEFKYVIEYLVNALLILSPFIFLIFIISSKKSKTKYPMQRTYRVLFWLFLIFFAISSLRGHVEPHWIAFASVPLVILLYNRVLEREKLRKILLIASFTTLVIVIAARILLVVNIIPINTKFHGHKEMTSQIQNAASGLPVVFVNSYTGASLYEFYTGEKTYSSNNMEYRKNQYDLWDIENEFNDKDVFLVYPHKVKDAIRLINYNKEEKHCLTYHSFSTTEKFKLSFKDQINEITIDESTAIEIQITNPYSNNIRLKNPENSINIYLVLYKEGRYIKRIKVTCELPGVMQNNSSELIKGHLKITGVDPGEYSYHLSFKHIKIKDQFNSERYKINMIR